LPYTKAGMIGVALSIAMALNSGTAGYSIDEETAVKVAEQFAKEVGITQKLLLQSVQLPSGAVGYDNSYRIDFRLPDGRWGSSNVSLAGTIQEFHLELREWPTTKVRPAPTFLYESILKIVKAANPRREFLLRFPLSNPKGPEVQAVFDKCFDGHRFFDLKHADTVFVDAVNGQISGYWSGPAVPNISPSEPKISSNQAIRQLDLWARSHFQDEKTTMPMFESKSLDVPVMLPELGYVKLKTQSGFRLVWEAHLWTHRGNQRPKEWQVLPMFVDGDNGCLIPQDAVE